MKFEKVRGDLERLDGISANNININSVLMLMLDVMRDTLEETGKELTNLKFEEEDITIWLPVSRALYSVVPEDMDKTGLSEKRIDKVNGIKKNLQDKAGNIEKLEKEILEMQSAADILEKTKEEYQLKLAEKRETQKRVAALRRETDEIEKQISSISDVDEIELNSKKQEKERLFCEKKAKEIELHNLEKETNSIKEEMSNQQTTYEQLKGEKVRVEADIQDIKKNIELCGQLIQNADGEKQKFIQELKDKEEAVKVIQADLSKKKEQLEDLEKQYSSLQEKYDEASSEYKKVKEVYDKLLIEEQNKETEIQNIQTDIDKAEKKIKIMETEKEDMDERLSKKYDEISKIQDDINNLNQSLEEIPISLENKKAELVEQQEKYEELKKEFNNVNKDYIKVANEVVARVKLIKTANEAKDKENLNLAQKEKDLEKIQHDIEQLRVEIDNISSTYQEEVKKIAELETELRERTEAFDELGQQVSVRETELKDCTNKVRKLETRKRELETELEEMEKKKLDLEVGIEKDEKNIELYRLFFNSDDWKEKEKRKNIYERIIALYSDAVMQLFKYKVPVDSLAETEYTIAFDEQKNQLNVQLDKIENQLRELQDYYVQIISGIEEDLKKYGMYML